MLAEAVLHTHVAQHFGSTPPQDEFIGYFLLVAAPAQDS
jgi:hypothetical protein